MYHLMSYKEIIEIVKNPTHYKEYDIKRIFLENEKTNMSAYHTDLLKKQSKAMNEYLNILKARIDDLSKQFKECK